MHANIIFWPLQSDITDDASFFDAMEYFTPAAVSSTFTPASEQITSPTVSEGSSGSSDGNGTAVPSSTATSSPRATIEMHIQVKIFSRITLSDFAPSSAGSVSAGGNNRAWDSESESEAGESGVEYYEYGDDGDEWSQSNGSYPRHQHQHQQPSSSSSTSSQYRPPLNGKQRLASLHSYTEEQEEDEDDQGTEYAFSGASVNDNRRMFHGRSVPFDVTSPPTVHLGATCIVCGVKPIQGVRYICVMCHGVPSFVSMRDEQIQIILVLVIDCKSTLLPNPAVRLVRRRREGNPTRPSSGHSCTLEARRASVIFEQY